MTNAEKEIQMIKFEEHDNQLFRMLEEPDAINEFSKTPCVIACKYGDLKKYYILDSPTSNPSMSMLAEGFEIVGYPVVDGSAEWALWQMEQGKKVCHKSYTMKTTHCAINDESQVVIFTTPYSVANGGDVVCHADEWLDLRQYGFCAGGVDERTGWQLYEEPEYKVGDYIKNGGDYYIVTSPTTCVGLRYGLSHEICPKTCKIVSPSEVIIHIGCLSGTVEKAQDYAYFLLWHSKTDCDYSMIKWDALDIPTRELVESLLKAQEVK